MSSQEPTERKLTFAEIVRESIAHKKLKFLQRMIEEFNLQKESGQVELPFPKILFYEEQEESDKEIHEMIQETIGSTLKYTLTKPICEYPRDTLFEDVKLIGKIDHDNNTVEFTIELGEPSPGRHPNKDKTSHFKILYSERILGGKKMLGGRLSGAWFGA